MRVASKKTRVKLLWRGDVVATGVTSLTKASDTIHSQKGGTAPATGQWCERFSRAFLPTCWSSNAMPSDRSWVFPVNSVYQTAPGPL